MKFAPSPIYIQYILAVQNREKLLKKPWRDDVFQHMSEFIKNIRQNPIIVNGGEDHLHILTGLRTNISIEDFFQQVKSSSAEFVNEQGFVDGGFDWQETYMAFSCGSANLERIYNYISNQEDYHQKKTFDQECLEYFERYEVPYNERDVFV
jgi:REP element-mobilizing transposase RayT